MAGPNADGLPITGRLVVISPHLDDAVFSLGATIAAATGRGVAVDIVTVFAGMPESQAPAGPWDKACGFDTEGRAASHRRAEDRAACGLVGAAPHWLSLSDEQYGRPRDRQAVRAAVAQLAQGAAALLMPGHPLTAPDHRWVSETLLGAGAGGFPRMGFYIEQPYALQFDGSSETQQLDRKVSWQYARAGIGALLVKSRAISAYSSQLRLVGYRWPYRWRMLLQEQANGGEAIAWIDRGASSTSRITDDLLK